MKYGFIGLGNLGANLAGSLLRNGFDVTVTDINKDAAAKLLAQGAHWAPDPQAVAEQVDAVFHLSSLTVHIHESARRYPVHSRRPETWRHLD